MSEPDNDLTDDLHDVIASLRAEVAELRKAMKPFETFAITTKRMMEMDPNRPITQGSPMAAPQLYARDFLALLEALANVSGEPE